MSERKHICPDCRENLPMTVRDLLHYLIENTDDLDARVDIAVESGDNTVVFTPFDVQTIETGDDDEPMVAIFAATTAAWNTATSEELESGVLVLEEPVDA